MMCVAEREKATRKRKLRFMKGMGVTSLESRRQKLKVRIRWRKATHIIIDMNRATSELKKHEAFVTTLMRLQIRVQTKYRSQRVVPIQAFGRMVGARRRVRLAKRGLVLVQANFPPPARPAHGA